MEKESSCNIMNVPKLTITSTSMPYECTYYANPKTAFCQFVHKAGILVQPTHKTGMADEKL